MEIPAVADYWPDRADVAPGGPAAARHAVSPPAADPPAAGPPAAEQPPPDRLRLTPGGVAALALLLVIGGVLGMFVSQAGTGDRAAPVRPAPVRPAAPALPEVSAGSPVPTGPVPVATAPPTRSAPALRPAVPPAAPAPKLPATATFEMAATARSVTVRTGDLGAGRYRVTLGAGAAPVSAKVSDDGTNHRLTLVKEKETPAPPITITLNAGIRWNLELTAGNSETDVDLTGSKLASLELAGGARVFTLALPEVTGTLPVRISHGMNQLTIDTRGAAVRLSLRVGAGKVILDGRTRTGTEPGRVFTSAGRSGATGRIDIDSVEGVGTLTVGTGG